MISLHFVLRLAHNHQGKILKAAQTRKQRTCLRNHHLVQFILYPTKGLPHPSNQSHIRLFHSKGRSWMIADWSPWKKDILKLSERDQTLTVIGTRSELVGDGLWSAVVSGRHTKVSWDNGPRIFRCQGMKPPHMCSFAFLCFYAIVHLDLNPPFFFSFLLDLAMYMYHEGTKKSYVWKRFIVAS